VMRSLLLKVLDLNNNYLKGEIPKEIGKTY
jgi:hypothetical protein